MTDSPAPMTLTPAQADSGLLRATASNFELPLRQAGFGLIEHVEVTGSTNADLLALPFGQSPGEAAFRWADHQQAGRGRRGRHWVDRPGLALTLSMAFERDTGAEQSAAPLAAFSLVAGLMVAQTLASSGLAGAPLQLKWPNDVLIGGNKVAGILVELKQRGPLQRIVVGCGINLFAPAVDPAEHAALTPGGLFGVATPATGPVGLAIRQKLAVQLATRMIAAHADYFESGLGPYRQSWMACHAYQDMPVKLIDGQHLLAEGVCRGIDESGSLLVETSERLQAFVIGEVSARPVGALS